MRPMASDEDVETETETEQVADTDRDDLREMIRIPELPISTYTSRSR